MKLAWLLTMLFIQHHADFAVISPLFEAIEKDDINYTKSYFEQDCSSDRVNICNKVESSSWHLLFYNIAIFIGRRYTTYKSDQRRES